jgi:septal ring factor EnvC (AmiA/AmiB activator)
MQPSLGSNAPDWAEKLFTYINTSNVELKSEMVALNTSNNELKKEVIAYATEVTSLKKTIEQMEDTTARDWKKRW